MNSKLQNTCSKKALIIKFCITILTTFIILSISCITLGIMKKAEYEEYARTVENPNITTVIGPLLLNGPAFTFLIALIVSIISKIFIKKNQQMRKIICFVPLYVCLLTIPTWFLIFKICNVFNITF